MSFAYIEFDPDGNVLKFNNETSAQLDHSIITLLNNLTPKVPANVGKKGLIIKFINMQNL